LQARDINLAHRHHGLHHASGLGGVGIGQQRDERARYDLPRESEFILEPAAPTGAAAVCKLRPKDIDFRLIDTVDAERDGFFGNDLPNPAWLRNGPPSAAQQAFGLDLLRTHGAFVVPSVACNCSWNLVFSAADFKGRYVLEKQQAFALEMIDIR
jgi:hypothetical protein